MNIMTLITLFIRGLEENLNKNLELALDKTLKNECLAKCAGNWSSCAVVVIISLTASVNDLTLLYFHTISHSRVEVAPAKKYIVKKKKKHIQVTLYFEIYFPKYEKKNGYFILKHKSQ